VQYTIQQAVNMDNMINNTDSQVVTVGHDFNFFIWNLRISLPEGKDS